MIVMYIIATRECSLLFIYQSFIFRFDKQEFLNVRLRYFSINVLSDLDAKENLLANIIRKWELKMPLCPDVLAGWRGQLKVASDINGNLKNEI